jgi:hypothetical protein
VDPYSIAFTDRVADFCPSTYTEAFPSRCTLIPSVERRPQIFASHRSCTRQLVDCREEDPSPLEEASTNRQQRQEGTLEGGLPEGRRGQGSSRELLGRHL